MDIINTILTYIFGAGVILFSLLFLVWIYEYIKFMDPNRPIDDDDL